MASFLFNILTDNPLDFGSAGVAPYSTVGNLPRHASKAITANGELGGLGSFMNGVEADSPSVYPAGAIFYVNGASGTLTATIGGVAIAVGTGVSDLATSTALVTAINASTNALIQGQVMASNTLTNQVSCTSVVVGDSLSFAGQTFVAVALGSPELDGQFALGASDADTAASLVASIKRSSAMWLDYLVFASGNFVIIVQKQTGAVLAASSLVSNAPTRLAVSALAPSTLFAVWSCVPSWLGNHMTVAASGTGLSVFLDSSGRMFGGTGLSGVPITGFGG